MVRRLEQGTVLLVALALQGSEQHPGRAGAADPRTAGIGVGQSGRHLDQLLLAPGQLVASVIRELREVMALASEVGHQLPQEPLGRPPEPLGIVGVGSGAHLTGETNQSFVIHHFGRGIGSWFPATTGE